MKKLEELDWFKPEWAKSVQISTRKLVCAYAEAYEAIEAMPKALQLVDLSGIWHYSRRLVLFKFLLRYAVASHIEVMHKHANLLRLRAFRASRPTAEDLRFLHVKKPTEEEKTEANQKLATFQAKQQTVASALDEATTDFALLHERIANEGKVGAKLFKQTVSFVRRFLPVAWAWWVVHVINNFPQGSSWQMWSVSVAVIAVYHILGLLGVPFHDASERKHIFFDGYMGGAGSDGLAPCAPPMARLEKEFFKLFGQKPPLVLLWDQVVPLLHYLVAGLFVVVIAWKLPLAEDQKRQLWAAAIALNILYFWRVKTWWLLLKRRYPGRSVSEILLALFLSSQVLDFEQEESPGKE